MQSIRQIQRLNDAELEKCVPPNASWHTDYRDTAYIHIGGLPFELSEGDVVTIFSQYGNPVHVNLVRDKDTGKSRGFAFLKYEDQRSCDVAVDNLGGAGVLGRVLSVDHARYKLKEGEVEGLGLNEGVDAGVDDETDKEDGRTRKRRRTDSVSEEERPMIKEEIELAKLLREHDDDDPMKAYLVQEKKEQVAEALKGSVARRAGDGGRKESHRHRRSRKDERDQDDRKKDRHRSRRAADDDDDDFEKPGNGHRSRGHRDGEFDEERERAHRSRREGSKDRRVSRREQRDYRRSRDYSSEDDREDGRRRDDRKHGEESLRRESHSEKINGPRSR